MEMIADIWSDPDEVDSIQVLEMKKNAIFIPVAKAAGSYLLSKAGDRALRKIQKSKGYKKLYQPIKEQIEGEVPTVEAEKAVENPKKYLYKKYTRGLPMSTRVRIAERLEEIRRIRGWKGKQRLDYLFLKEVFPDAPNADYLTDAGAEYLINYLDTIIATEGSKRNPMRRFRNPVDKEQRALDRIEEYLDAISDIDGDNLLVQTWRESYDEFRELRAEKNRDADWFRQAYQLKDFLEYQTLRLFNKYGRSFSNWQTNRDDY